MCVRLFPALNPADEEHTMARADILLIPNLVSLSRILVAPLVYLFLVQHSPPFLPLLLLTSWIILSDFLDGILARHLDQKCRLGLILDPLGDKACLVAAIIALLASGRISAVLFAALLFKDVCILLGAALIAGKHKIIIPSNATGKWTTALLACGLATLAILEFVAKDLVMLQSLGIFPGILATLARIALLAGTFLAILSLAGYGAEALRQAGNPPRKTLLFGLALVLGTLLIILVLRASEIPSIESLPGPWL